MKTIITSKIVEKLIAMLSKHYELPSDVIKTITNLSETEAEQKTATLITFSFCGKEKTNVNVSCTTQETKTVLILNVPSKLLFVKAVKESCNYGIKEAKEVADKLLCRRTENNYNFYSDKFSVGKDGIFTINEWENIVAMLGPSEITWRYV